jgi:hypothetical protein
MNFKKFYIIVILLLSSLKIFSQTNYLRVNIGAALPNGTQEKLTMPSDIETKAVNFSLGKGMNYGITLGHIFKKNLTAELGVNYLMGFNANFIKYKATDANFNQKTVTESIKGSFISLTPAVIFKAEMKKFEPYARIGVIIALPSFKLTNTGDTTKITNYKGGLAIGFNTALGAYYKLSKRIFIYSEFNITGLSYSPTKSEITRYDINGKSILNNLNAIDKKTEYKKSLTVDPSDSQLTDFNQPRQLLKQKYPFGSIGLNIGVRYNF